MREVLRHKLRGSFTRANLPLRGELSLALLTSVLLILAFPDFNLWFLAWVAFAPLLFAIAHRQSSTTAFLLGWTSGTIFFYGSCYWLTHAMIFYGGIPSWLAYLLLAPATLIVGLFPALFAAIFARLCRIYGIWRALTIAPFIWTATEWLRFEATGQLWNAVGYSQAFHPDLIQAARWGGVYAVGFLIFVVNAALTALLINLRGRASRKTLVAAIASIVVVAITIYLQTPKMQFGLFDEHLDYDISAVLVAVQPNVPVNFRRTPPEREMMLREHFDLSLRGFQNAEPSQFKNLPRIVVFPESPANFSYAYDARFREAAEDFTRANQTSLIFNSLEPAPGDGYFNSALMLNAQGRKVAQYDKIRLVAFGEYMPLPKWFPLTWLLGAIVGDFTPGSQYTLMTIGDDGKNIKTGVSICVESAYPEIARAFTRKGADVLINITNDGYLGRTAVLRQHLANGVFRAVENERPFLNITNTGITAYINEDGEISDETGSYETAVRTWTLGSINDANEHLTFYTRYGDVFAFACAALSLLFLLKRKVLSEGRL